MGAQTSYPSWMDGDFSNTLAGGGINYGDYSGFGLPVEQGLSASAPKPTFANSADNGFSLGGLADGSLLGNVNSFVDGISGLADMWFKYDSLKAQKNSARDAHEANRTVYNNSLARAKDVQYSISGKPTTDNRANIKGTTV